jgi:hypothetical protein
LIVMYKSIRELVLDGKVELLMWRMGAFDSIHFWQSKQSDSSHHHYWRLDAYFYDTFNWEHSE